MSPGRSRWTAAVMFVTLVAGCTQDATAPSHKGPLHNGLVVSIVSGNGQSAVVGTALPNRLVVSATDSAGRPIASVPVHFDVTGGGGRVSAEAVSTDDSGFAAPYWTLGTSTATDQRVEVRTVTSSGDQEAIGTFLAKALAGPATNIAVLAGNNQTALTNARLPVQLAVAVTDQYGNRVPDATVSFTTNAGSGSVNPNSARTGGTGVAWTTGVARTSWTLGPNPGFDTLVAAITVGGMAVFSATADREIATTIDVYDSGCLTPGQVAVPGSTIRPAVGVLDQYYNHVPNVTVSFAIHQGGGSVSPDAATTDSMGFARTSWTLGPSPADTNTLAATITVGADTHSVSLHTVPGYCWGSISN